MPAAPRSSPVTLVWFRRDLRLDDHPALRHAAQRGGAVVPVYIWSPDEESPWAPGAASRWWLHRSLESLDAQLRGRGLRLILRRGPTLETLEQLVAQTGADAVAWNRLYDPSTRSRDERVATALSQRGTATARFNGSLLFEPHEIQTREAKPYQVFTPFWRACQAAGERPQAESTPLQFTAPKQWPASDSLDDWRLQPRIAWDAGLRTTWTPGAESAERLAEEFARSTAELYASARDLPATPGTSRLSPHLHFGEISPRRIWHAVRSRSQRSSAPDGDEADDAEVGRWTYLKELAWREFAHHLLFHFPRTSDQPLRPEFSQFPWQTDDAGLRAWQRGTTGYPIVDAGMRELWTTGWMHNRVRMIAGSFLVKDLRISWLEGARWFWDTLVDADLAANTLGWQWTAGCGADAAPYFRVFHPVLQSEKFDPEGEYLRRWLPELRRLPTRWLHKPWEAPRTTLAAAGVVLGRDYPRPIVDHGDARKRALAAFESLRKK